MLLSTMLDFYKPKRVVIAGHNNCIDGSTSMSLIYGGLKNWVKTREVNELFTYVIPVSYGKTSNSFERVMRIIRKQDLSRTDTMLIIVDFSFSAQQTQELACFTCATVVLDHHATAEENLSSLSEYFFSSGDYGTQEEDIQRLNRDDEHLQNLYISLRKDRSGAGLSLEFVEDKNKNIFSPSVHQTVKFVQDGDLFTKFYSQSRAVGRWLVSATEKFIQYDICCFSSDQNNDGYCDLPELWLSCMDNCPHEFIQQEQYYNHVINKLAATGFTPPGTNRKVFNVPPMFFSDLADHVFTNEDRIALCANIYLSPNKNGLNKDFSFRSKEKARARVIAQKNGGGGHDNAASVSFERVSDEASKLETSLYATGLLCRNLDF